MTKEEALEVVMYGDSWRMCKDCDGYGSDCDVDSISFKRRLCDACLGHGKIFNLEYEIARKLLDIPVHEAYSLVNPVLKDIYKDLPVYQDLVSGTVVYYDTRTEDDTHKSR